MPETTIYRLILIGFGAAGQGFAQILRYHSGWLVQRYGIDVRLVAVCTRSRGRCMIPKGSTRPRCSTRSSRTAT
ncbi:MAG: hypothetical protein U0Z44_19665 [Kouleothrix sp.]